MPKRPPAPRAMEEENGHSRLKQDELGRIPTTGVKERR